jgi:hypothetical protein
MPWCDRFSADGRHQVTLIGNGISDHLDLLAEPEFEESSAGLAYAFLDELPVTYVPLGGMLGFPARQGTVQVSMGRDRIE